MDVTYRLRSYLNLGVVFFVIGLILTGIGEEFTVLIALAFNLMIYRKLSGLKQNKWTGWIAVVSILITFSSFVIQYQYRRIIDWGSIKFISDYQANTSYLLTTLLFSIVTWEVGVALVNRLFKQNSERS